MSKHYDQRLFPRSVAITPDIEEYCMDNNINLSEWVRETFTKEFLSFNSKIIYLRELEQEKERVMKELHQIKEEVLRLYGTLSKAEVRYVAMVPARLQEGKELHSMKNFFNTEFRHNNKKASFNLDEFRGIVEWHSKTGEFSIPEIEELEIDKMRHI